MATLSNVDIENEIKKHGLLSNHKKENIGSASYELRMGDTYYDLTESDNPISIESYENVIIKPGHIVVLITKEKLNIPNNIIARVISKGSLFSVGLTPVCTNADPGFKGNLGIVTQNISDKYIVIPKDEAIAKIDFSELKSISTNPYIGQHGFHTGIWPIKKQLQKKHSELKEDPRLLNELAEGYKIIPNPMAAVIKKLVRYQKLTTWSMILLMLINVGLIAALSQRWLDSVTSFVISVLASILVLFLTIIFDRFDKT